MINKITNKVFLIIAVIFILTATLTNVVQAITWIPRSAEQIKADLTYAMQHQQIYLTKWGDTIWEISQATGIDSQKLAEINDLDLNVAGLLPTGIAFYLNDEQKAPAQGKTPESENLNGDFVDETEDQPVSQQKSEPEFDLQAEPSVATNNGLSSSFITKLTQIANGEDSQLNSQEENYQSSHQVLSLIKRLKNNTGAISEVAEAIEEIGDVAKSKATNLFTAIVEHQDIPQAVAELALAVQKEVSDAHSEIGAKLTATQQETDPSKIAKMTQETAEALTLATVQAVRAVATNYQKLADQTSETSGTSTDQTSEEATSSAKEEVNSEKSTSSSSESSNDTSNSSDSPESTSSSAEKSTESASKETTSPSVEKSTEPEQTNPSADTSDNIPVPPAPPPPTNLAAWGKTSATSAVTTTVNQAVAAATGLVATATSGQQTTGQEQIEQLDQQLNQLKTELDQKKQEEADAKNQFEQVSEELTKINQEIAELDQKITTLDKSTEESKELSKQKAELVEHQKIIEQQQAELTEKYNKAQFDLANLTTSYQEKVAQKQTIQKSGTIDQQQSSSSVTQPSYLDLIKSGQFHLKKVDPTTVNNSKKQDEPSELMQELASIRELAAFEVEDDTEEYVDEIAAKSKAEEEAKAERDRQEREREKVRAQQREEEARQQKQLFKEAKDTEKIKEKLAQAAGKVATSFENLNLDSESIFNLDEFLAPKDSDSMTNLVTSFINNELDLASSNSKNTENIIIYTNKIVENFDSLIKAIVENFDDVDDDDLDDDEKRVGLNTGLTEIKSSIEALKNKLSKIYINDKKDPELNEKRQQLIARLDQQLQELADEAQVIKERFDQYTW